MADWDKNLTFWQNEIIFSLLKIKMELLKKLQIVARLGGVITFLTTLLLRGPRILPGFILWCLCREWATWPKGLPIQGSSIDRFNFRYFFTLLNIFDCHDVRYCQDFFTNKCRQGWSRPPKDENTTKWNVLKVFSMFCDPIGLDFCNRWSLIWKG